jgi:predicted nucleotidyltransferase component of viral defense system
MDKTYVETVRLLLEITPVVFETPHFAMKGGTAINLFVEDMPRLSVDVDVVYTDYQANRDAALESIAKGLDAARRRLVRMGIEAELSTTKTGDEIKLFVRRGRHQVKIEVNHVFRGTVLPVASQRLSAAARMQFTTELSAPVLATSELYGSKLVAAMDRQHPRDLFDVRSLLDRGGLTVEVVECFVCYLAGHNRPVHEVLFSHDLDIEAAFDNEFAGMARLPVTLAELRDIRRKLRSVLPSMLTPNQRQFLLGLVAGEPNWKLMKCPHLSQLPAIRWKLENLAKLKKSNPHKFGRQLVELESRLREY